MRGERGCDYIGNCCPSDRHPAAKTSRPRVRMHQAWPRIGPECLGRAANRDGRRLMQLGARRIPFTGPLGRPPCRDPQGTGTPMCLSAGTDQDSVGGQMPAGRVCAVVVVYYPDGGLADRLRAILLQVDTLILVDNTPINGVPLQLPQFPDGREKLHLVVNGENMGVAFALNQGLRHALECGCRWLLTLDQDSYCYPDMVRTLLQVYEACDPRPAVVGGNYFDPRNGKLAVSEELNGLCCERKTVITSGALVDTQVAEMLGGFRTDYFIDQIDHEFCLRARAHGMSVMISRKPVMEHSVGSAGGAWLPLVGRLPSHPPVRKYYTARNSVRLVCEYWRKEPQWCLRRVIRLLLGLVLMATLESQRLAKVRAFMAGLTDGLRNRMGPCPHG